MPSSLESLLKIEVPLIVQLAEREMSLAEVLALSPGALVELPKPADEDLTILINNKPVGLGAAVKVGENFGVRISFVGNVKERLETLQAGDE